MGKRGAGEDRFLAVDLGGTKILSVVCDERGVIRARDRRETPRGDDPAEVVAAMEAGITAVLEKAKLKSKQITAIGVAIPGVVDPKRGLVVRTPNSCLADLALGPHLETRFGTKVVLGNDCNLGTLGEAWLGAGRNASSVFGIFVGTGIGAGFVRNRKIWRGAREVAGEIGHMVMEIDGPVCGCGNRGCFEAIAGRTAIEREIREAIARGEQTVLSDLLQGDLIVIKSRMLRQALEQGDPLVGRIVGRASEVIAYACLNVRHLIDPEWIILGGGVIEACGEYMWDTIQKIIEADQLPGARKRGGVCLSALGDDAVVLGATVTAARAVKRNVFKTVHRIAYPNVQVVSPGNLQVGEKKFDKDVLVLSDGTVKTVSVDENTAAAEERTRPPDLCRKLCRGGVELVILGTGFQPGAVDPSPFYSYFGKRRISVIALPTPQAVGTFQRAKGRRAAFFCVKT